MTKEKSFDDRLDDILCKNLVHNGFDGTHIAMTADTITAIKQLINTELLPVKREIKRVKQSGYGTGSPVSESSATHYSMGYNRAIDEASDNLWGDK